MFGETLSVSEAQNLINENIKASTPALVIEGEVSGFNVNRGKFVFFDLKDDEAILPCFMMLFSLKYPLEDGMKVKVLVEPGLTAKGRFSLTVRELQPVGEGSLKKAYEALRKKLDTEGLFAIERKRVLPEFPQRIGVVSSSGAAGWADFSKILNERWGGVEVQLADVGVQGLNAPAEIIQAIEYFNQESELVDVLVVIRGGGSADDLAAFNHEDVVRAVAASRIPTVVGIGHETDESLAELAADKRASTPSNAAQLVVPDKKDFIRQLGEKNQQAARSVTLEVQNTEQALVESQESLTSLLDDFFQSMFDSLAEKARLLSQLNPEIVLKRGYGILRSSGEVVTSVTSVTIGQKAELELNDGKLGVTVDGKH